MSNTKAYIGLTNPKSPDNVGAVLRAAGCYGVQGVRYTGTRYDKAQSFRTDTKNVQSAIPLESVASFQESLPSGAVPVAIELVEGAVPLTRYQHPDNAFYIFGPEDSSLDQAVVNWCRDVVYIPTKGCMNLAATVNVVLYDRLAKQSEPELGDSLIRASRDNNNRLKV